MGEIIRNAAKRTTRKIEAGMGARTRPKISERHVQQAVEDFLRIDSWRIIHTDLQRLRGLGVQEKGMPDCLAIRYDCRVWADGMLTPCDKPCAQVLWIEFKRPGKAYVDGNKLTKHEQEQLDWRNNERRSGAVVMVVDDYSAFREAYKAMDLLRKIKA